MERIRRGGRLVVVASSLLFFFGVLARGCELVGPDQKLELVYKIDFLDTAASARPSVLAEVRQVTRERVRLRATWSRVADVDEAALRVLVPAPDTGDDDKAIESLDAVIRRPGRFQFRFVVDSRSGVDAAGREARLRRYLGGLDARGVEWTPDNVDLSHLESETPAGGGSQWFPYLGWAAASETRRSLPFALLEADAATPICARDIERTYATEDASGALALGFVVGKERAAAFTGFAKENEGRRLAVLVDGGVLGSVTLGPRMNGRGVISGGEGGFSKAGLGVLRDLLHSGELPRVELSLVGSRRLPD